MTTAIGASPTTATATPATTATDNDSLTSSTLTDYEDFLTLLTAQMENQDPLNPQDSSEWIAQLAQFSSVEQQVNMNTKLDELIALSSADNVAELSSWLGTEVSAPNVGFTFDGQEQVWAFPADSSADEARLLVRDASGAVVATLPASPSGGDVEWDGAQDDGGQAPAGVYDLEYAYSRQTADGVESWSVLPDGASRVVEARQGDGGTELFLENGQRILASDVASVRADGGATDGDDGETESGGVIGAVGDAIGDAADAVVDAVT